MKEYLPTGRALLGISFVILSIFLMILAIFGKISLDHRPLLRRTPNIDIYLFKAPIFLTFISLLLGLSLLKFEKKKK